MTGGIFGGGVIFVVAALLWTAVLVPSWIRRREFRDAERHALRLQRTLRVLAETAEVPTEVRVEATAREALAQEKILRTAQRQRAAEHAAELAAAEAEQVRAEIHAEQMKRKQATMTRAQKLRRPFVRRIRACGALVGLLSVLGMLVGAGVAIAGQGFAALFISAVLFAAASGLLVLLAPGRVAAPAVIDVPAPIQTPVRVTESIAEEPEVAASALAAEQARAHALAQAEARAQSERARALARARAQAQAAAARERANQPESILLQDAPAATGGAATGETAAQPTSSPQRPAPTTAVEVEEVPSRFAQMGHVGDTSAGMLDLDAVLRSRRQAG